MLEGKVILIADDDLTLLEMYEERLKAEGCIIVTAKNGEEALEKVAESKPDLILLDIMMPKISGFEVLENIKKDPQTSAIPVIILTALGDSSKKTYGTELGAVDYIVKAETLPIDVIEKIRRALANSNS